MPGPRLYVLDLGRMRVDRSLLVAGAAAGPVDIPISAYVIRHADGNVLFDTGCHQQAMGPGGRWSPAFQAAYPWSGGEACQLPNRLAALGLGPDDFAAVVLSHLHSDHAGCVECFRRSRLIVHADELNAARQACAAREDDGYCAADMRHWPADPAWWPVARTAGDMDLNDAVRVLNWGSGHAAGMLGLRVRLPESGTIILASDAIYGADNFTAAFRRPGFLRDAAGYDRTVRRISRLAGAERAQVWFGHDPAQFATLRPSTEGWYA